MLDFWVFIIFTLVITWEFVDNLKVFIVMLIYSTICVYIGLNIGLSILIGLYILVKMDY